jgi:hypothetical protein
MAPSPEKSKTLVNRGWVLALGSVAAVAVAKNTGSSSADQVPLKAHQPLGITHTTHTGNKHPAEHCVTSTSPGSGKEKIKREIFDVFVSHLHLSVSQAAGIDGNLQQESDLSTSGDGLAQWTGERKLAMQHYAARHNMSSTDPKAQLSYIAVELTDRPGAAEDDRPALKDLRATHTARDAAVVFSNEYERPGIPALENRIRYAEQSLHQLGHIACVTHPGIKARIALPIHS